MNTMIAGTEKIVRTYHAEANNTARTCLDNIEGVHKGDSILEPSRVVEGYHVLVVLHGLWDASRQR